MASFTVGDTKWEEIVDDRHKNYTQKDLDLPYKPPQWFKVRNTNIPKEIPLGKDWPYAYCVLSMRYKAYMEEILNHQVSPDDVWIITSPKSGTTWGSELVWLVMNNFDFEMAKRIPFISRTPTLRTICKWTKPSIKQNEFDLYMNDKTNSKPQTPPPYVIKNHLPTALLPRSIWTVKPKIFYVARNPKDVALSFFEYFKSHYYYSGTLEEFLDLFMDGLLEFGPQLEHIRDFWNLRCEPNIFFTTYEEIYNDLGMMIQRAAKFLQKKVTVEQIQESIKYLNINSMRENINPEFEKGDLPDEALKKISKAFFRKGQAGGYKDDMPPEYIKKFDEWILRELPDCELAKTWLG